VAALVDQKASFGSLEDYADGLGSVSRSNDADFTGVIQNAVRGQTFRRPTIWTRSAKYYFEQVRRQNYPLASADADWACPNLTVIAHRVTHPC
jgi:hypothetical protein